MTTPPNVQPRLEEEENLEETLYNVHMSVMLEGFLEYLHGHGITANFVDLTSAPATTHSPGPQRRQQSRVPGHVLLRPHELMYINPTPQRLRHGQRQTTPENEPDQFTADDLCQMFAGPQSYDETVDCAICCVALKGETETDPTQPVPVPLVHTQAQHVEFKCKHRFHTACIRPWLVQNRTCPVCRGNVFQQLICQ